VAGRVYRVLVDGVQVGELWTRPPLVEYLRMLRCASDQPVHVRVEVADLGPWHPVGLDLDDDP
jgi:hypothetical protein